MITRRQLLKQAALLSAGSLLIRSSHASAPAPSKQVGVQLYTLRNDIGKDPTGTLTRVAELGYKEVENFGYNGKLYGLELKAYKELVDKLGLSPVSGHYMYSAITGNWQKAVDDASLIGQKYMVLAFLLPGERKTIDNYKKIAADLNKAGEICKKAGIQLCYHNHDFEFQPLEGQIPFDILMGETDKNLVKTELDLFWAVKAGYQPIDLFNKYPGRIVLWHVKDMDNTEKKSFTEVGNGTIDFTSIFKQAKKSGLEHFFVEQDICPGSPFDSISQSIGYIRNNLVKLL